jgi:hypothetical protein
MAAIALGSSLCAVQTAHASPMLTLQVGGNAAYSVTLSFVSANNDWEFHSGTLNVGATGLVSNGSGVFTVDVAVQDNTPGGTTAQLLNTTTDVRESGAGGAPRDLVLTVSETQFQSPVGTNLSLQGSLNVTSLGTANVDTVGLTGLFNSDTAHQVTVSPTSSTGTTNATSMSISNTTTPFSLSNAIAIHLNPGSSAQATGTVQLVGPTQAAPEPSTFALAVTGFVALGFAGLRLRLRRSRRKETAVL